MNDSIKKIEVFPLAIPRDTPYLGPLEPGIIPNEKGYFIRPGNRSIYSINDHSILVKVTTKSGAVGWGESYSIVAPRVTASLVDELLNNIVLGRDPNDVVAIYEDLYNAMRVRGFHGGFYLDAIAGLDIALWDIKGKLTGLPVCNLLGSKRYTKIPVYVSGLPKATRAERTELAQEFIGRGFSSIKFASAVAHDGEVAEIETLRKAIGPSPRILVDLHWRYTDQEAIKLITQMEEYDLYLAEAPVHSEDIEGQARVVQAVKTPIGIGEEFRTIYEYMPRFKNRCMSVIQPEMAHTGITAFWQICIISQAYHCRVFPHASIGIGIFQAASLQVSAALQNLGMHEYQHSIFDRNLRYVTGNMSCREGFFHLPDGPGLGVEPTDEVFKFVIS